MISKPELKQLSGKGFILSLSAAENFLQHIDSKLIHFKVLIFKSYLFISVTHAPVLKTLRFYKEIKIISNSFKKADAQGIKTIKIYIF